MSLDALLGSRGRPVVDLWHIDTEGAELPVLRSAAASLAACRLKKGVHVVRGRAGTVSATDGLVGHWVLAARRHPPSVLRAGWHVQVLPGKGRHSQQWS